MNKQGNYLIYVATMLLLCSVACARTLTFDDVSSGTVLDGSYRYYHDYRVRFGAFKAIDHYGAFWGNPHSGHNVLMWNGGGDDTIGEILFGYFTLSNCEIEYVQSVSAYFSTNNGAAVRITAYGLTSLGTLDPITSMVIGAPGESWNNEYVVINSPDNPFYLLRFEGVNSTDDLLNFCADDMTYVIPEPSSIISLVIGILGIGVGLRRRKG
jgi:hypothetical protein